MIEYDKKALCFDDILLVPQYGTISSRHDVDLSMAIGKKDKKIINLTLPVIAAPMDTVCDIDMCLAIADAGGMGIVHRYMSYDSQVNRAKKLSKYNINFGIAIASNNGFIDHAKSLYDVGVRVMLIDTANGHSEQAIKAVRAIKKLYNDVHIMAGNVATAEGFYRLANAGADSVRVGIGGGSACTTRLVSGHGIPTLASILEIANSNYYNLNCTVIADGGIRNSGDMVKAFAAGAGAVMVGSMLAGTNEAPGEILTDASGREFKTFRGMASEGAQKDATGKTSVTEGISTTIPYRGSVSHILNQIKGGLGSGCSYSGVDSLKDLHSESQYVKVSSLSINESRPHAL